LNHRKLLIFALCRFFFAPQGEKEPAKEEKYHAAAG